MQSCWGPGAPRDGDRLRPPGLCTWKREGWGNLSSADQHLKGRGMGPGSVLWCPVPGQGASAQTAAQGVDLCCEGGRAMAPPSSEVGISFLEISKPTWIMSCAKTEGNCFRGWNVSLLSLRASPNSQLNYWCCNLSSAAFPWQSWRDTDPSLPLTSRVLLHLPAPCLLREANPVSSIHFVHHYFLTDPYRVYFIIDFMWVLSISVSAQAWC